MSTNTHLPALFNLLVREAGVLVTVESVQGSGPREAGAWMAVFGEQLVNTIGGGHLELQAIDEARRRLHGDAAAFAHCAPVLRYALGPSLGQCCGGVVHLRYELIAASDLPALHQRLSVALTPLVLFGGGHVGKALIQVLGRLPFAVTWVDSRDEIFPDEIPQNVRPEHSDPVHLAVRDQPPASRVLIMSFSHAEDLDVVAECLTRQRERADLPFVGLIGSKTKWATFSRRLQAQGFSPAEIAHVTCPIGLPGISGKEPDVIAIAVAAQLLTITS